MIMNLIGSLDYAISGGRPNAHVNHPTQPLVSVVSNSNAVTGRA